MVGFSANEICRTMKAILPETPRVLSLEYGALVSTDAFVIGAGVIGLSTALRLARSGVRTTVYAAAPPHRTTSAAAGALWGPHLVGADDR
ncbi:MAG: FAD-dependent oxidoreductase, partial [Streptosporangiaceae bacterium]